MNLRTYPEYKDSGVEWIGEIPEEWNPFKLKFISRIETGTTPSKDDERYYSKGFFPWVKPDELNGLNPIKTSKTKLNKEGKALSRTIPKGSILVCCIGSLGKIGLAGVDLATNQQINSIIPNLDVLNPDFAKYLIFSSKLEYEKFANSNVVPIINKNQQGEIVYPVPPIEEQKAIVSFLDKKTSELDKTIEKDTRLIDLLQEKRTALINHVVTKGLDPEAPMKDSGIEWIGEIPEGWEVRNLDYAASNKNNSFVDGPFGSDLKNEEYVLEGIPLIQLNNIKIGAHDLSKLRYITEDKYIQLIRHSTLPGDIVIAKMADPVARATMVSDEFEKYVIVADCIKLTCNEHFSAKYLVYSLNSYMYHEASQKATGTTRLRTNLNEIKKLSVLVPNLVEQTHIVDYLDKKTLNIDKTIKKIQTNIDLLQEFKKSLIHHVVTGKVDVRDVV